MTKSLFLKISFISIVSFFSKNVIGQQAQRSDTLFADITAAQAFDSIQHHMDDPWFAILDVRTPGEYNPAHLQGGVNLNYNNPAFQTMLDSLNKHKIYLIHCASGSRSAQAKAIMRNKGFRCVYNMIGGISAWNAAGKPATTAVQPAVGLLSDSVYTWINQITGSNDTVEICISNQKNSFLQCFPPVFSHPEFTTNFLDTTTLSGAHDYCFQIYYQPDDLVSDTTIMQLETSGGIQRIYLVQDFSTQVKSDISKSDFYFMQDHDEIAVVYTGSEDLSFVKLYDVYGRMVCDKSFSSRCIFSKSSFPSGIYFLKVMNKNASQTFRFIKN